MLRQRKTTITAGNSRLFSTQNSTKSLDPKAQEIQEYLHYYESQLSSDLSAYEKLQLIKDQRQLLLSNTSLLKKIEAEPTLQESIVKAKTSHHEESSFTLELIKLLGPDVLGAFFPVLVPVIKLSKLAAAAASLTQTYRSFPYAQTKISPCRYANSEGPILSCEAGSVEVIYSRGAIDHAQVYHYAVTIGEGECKNLQPTAIRNLHECMRPEIGSIVAQTFPNPTEDLYHPVTAPLNVGGWSTSTSIDAKLFLSHKPQIYQNGFAKHFYDCVQHAAPCGDSELPLSANNSITHSPLSNITPTAPEKIEFDAASAMTPTQVAAVTITAGAVMAAIASFFIFKAQASEERLTHSYNLRPRLDKRQ